jgi:LysR family glycine cleavage system transcriptional activator
MPAEEELSGVPLSEEMMVVVAQPETAARLTGAADLKGLALIHHPGSDWSGWYARRQLAHDQAAGGLTVADAGLAIDAAAAGYGVARVPASLAALDLKAGRVAQALEGEPTDDRYWLVAPAPQWRQAKVKALVAFLTA